MTSPADAAPFRQAGPPDHAAVLGLIGEYYAYDGIAFDAPGIAPGLEVLLRDPSLGRVLLIEYQAGTAGYLIVTFGFDLEFGGRQATVTDLFLRSEARGLGLGSAVFAGLERFCLEQEVVALELQVEDENTAAQAFYRRLGFESHHRIPMSKRLIQQHAPPAPSPEAHP